MNSIRSRLFVIWLLCVAAGTLAPFNFTTGGGQDHGLKVFEYGPHGNAIHFVLNMLLFMPLGVLVHQARQSRSGQRGPVKLFRVAIVCGIVSISISMAVEYIQAFLPNRDSSLIDVLANVLGAMVGMAADRRWGSIVEARLARVRAATSPTMLAGLIGSCLVVALLISGALQARTRLSNWSPEYPLLVGNERTGDRPWRGRVFALDITDTAMPAASVHRFSSGEPVALPGARIAAFVFTGAAPFKDVTGHLPDLEWTERSNTSGQLGVRLPGGSWLRSGRPASALADRLGKTNAFTVRVRCATDDVNQTGPARIVSNSSSPLLRNFTLGQEGTRLVFRLRTPATGVNGYPLEVEVPRVFTDRQPREILATYDGATLNLAMAHGDDVTTELTPGASVALAIPPLNVRADEVQLYEMGYVSALSLIPGALIVLLGQTSRGRLAFSAAWVLAFAVLLEVTLVQASGRSFALADVARAAGAGALVLAILNVVFSSADVPWRRSARARADIPPVDRLDYQHG